MAHPIQNKCLCCRLMDGITSQLQDVTLNGPADIDGDQRYIGNLNLSFAYVEGESLIMGLKVNLDLTSDDRNLDNMRILICCGKILV